MILEGDTSVIDAIKEKKRLMDAGDAHDHIKILCFVDGGLMKGVYGAGAGLALQDLGYHNVFDSYVGVSAGAPSVAYFLTNQVQQGASLLYEECCSKQFLDFTRWSNMLNTQYIIDTMQLGGAKALLQDKLQPSLSRVRIAVTDFETAACELIQPKNLDELFSSMHASISMPGLVSKKIMVRGRRYLDGASAVPHPIQQAVETIDSTHVLVITNQDKSTGDVPFLEKLINHTLLRARFSRPLLAAANRRRHARHIYVDKILKSGVGKPVSLIWGNGAVGSFERNPDNLKQTIEASRQWWVDLLKD